MNSVKYLAPWHKHSEMRYWRYPIQSLFDEIEWKWRAEIIYREHPKYSKELYTFKYSYIWEVVYRKIDSGVMELLGYFSSIEEAKDAADKKLTECGYVFLANRERFERMRVLF